MARGIICDQGHDGSAPLFLIAKGRIPPRIWHLPGGGIGWVRTDKGWQKETPENALRRELFEELCLGPEQLESVAWIGQRPSRVLFVPHLEELFIVHVRAGLSRYPLNSAESPIRRTWELIDAKWVDAADFERLTGLDHRECTQAFFLA